MIYFIGAIIVVLVIYLFARPKSGTKQTPTENKWELVERKSQRWHDLGYGEGDNFPGYGKLYDREFDVWYCEVGSKERKMLQKFYDRNPLHYEPNNRNRKDVHAAKRTESAGKLCSDIIGEGIILDRLHNTKDYEALYTGLDNKNRKRWYFALVKFIPTGIETSRAPEIPEVETPNNEPEIFVPEGYTLVKRNSEEWIRNGFADKDFFPGYGKIFKRTFDVWFCEVGSKEKNIQPEFTDKAILNFYHGICGRPEILVGKDLKFESLSKKQGYAELLTALDSKEKRRWYFGLKTAEPTNIFTSAE